MGADLNFKLFEEKVPVDVRKAAREQLIEQMKLRPEKEAEIQENAERLHKAEPMKSLPECIEDC